ncbi:SAM-dependent methyltransferase [Agromyces sp. SYSU T00194]|uniref:SAM-dependent methyltransferase n=1 Tax=Agromyces chitinivorans TaxID=3158560 RepID=UPI003395F2F4
MDACCDPGATSRYEEIFDTRFAESVARRYRRRGLPRLDRRILAFLDDMGVRGASVLEIGGGVGELQLELLEHGAARAVNLELSGEYEGVARALATEHGLERRITRVVGVDLAERPDAVAPVDVVVLNRVVCCYPHAVRLLDAAAGRARRAVVFSHPPRTPWTLLRIGTKNLLHRISGKRFRGYLHRPAVMIDALRADGFEIPLRSRGARWSVIGAVRPG